MAEDGESAAPPAYAEMDFPEERRTSLKAAFEKAAKEGRVEHKEVRCVCVCGLRTCAHKANARCGPSAHQAHKLIFTDEERKEAAKFILIPAPKELRDDLEEGGRISDDEWNEFKLKNKLLKEAQMAHPQSLEEQYRKAL